MSDEDKKWLEQALKQYTFNDVDRLKEICNTIKDHSKMSQSDLMSNLEELLEIIELHVRNSLNLCISGGMQSIMEIIFNSPFDDARREACGIFSFSNQNNVEVQKITMKLGALNLLHQYIRETNVANRESVISALLSFLRGINTDGKRGFL